jgi:peptidoglycan hydrolase-like protein with peptidoglycan-binding domain
VDGHQLSQPQAGVQPDRNVQVYALQVALSTLNYYSDALDGEYGLKTQAAVKSFSAPIR